MRWGSLLDYIASNAEPSSPAHDMDGGIRLVSIACRHDMLKALGHTVNLESEGGRMRARKILAAIEADPLCEKELRPCLEAALGGGEDGEAEAHPGWLVEPWGCRVCKSAVWTLRIGGRDMRANVQAVNPRPNLKKAKLRLLVKETGELLHYVMGKGFSDGGEKC